MADEAVEAGAKALRDKAYECDGECGLRPAECLLAHPVNWSGSVPGDTLIEGTAKDVAAVVVEAAREPIERQALQRLAAEGELRDRLAEKAAAAHRAWVPGTLENLRDPRSLGERIADEQLPVVEAEIERRVAERLAESEARRAELENALNWQVSCTSCARMLDQCYAADAEAEKARAALEVLRRALAAFDGRGVLEPGRVDTDAPSAGEVLRVWRVAFEEADAGAGAGGLRGIDGRGAEFIADLYRLIRDYSDGDTIAAMAFGASLDQLLHVKYGVEAPEGETHGH